MRALFRARDSVCRIKRLPTGTRPRSLASKSINRAIRSFRSRRDVGVALIAHIITPDWNYRRASSFAIDRRSRLRSFGGRQPSNECVVCGRESVTRSLLITRWSRAWLGMLFLTRSTLSASARSGSWCIFDKGLSGRIRYGNAPQS